MIQSPLLPSEYRGIIHYILQNLKFQVLITIFLMLTITLPTTLFNSIRALFFKILSDESI